MMRVGLALLFLAPAAAFAALVPTPSVSVAISAAPAYQSPNSTVTLTAYTSVPKGEYTYTWTVDGAEAVSGVDRDSITIPTGAAGTQTTVDLSLANDSGFVGNAEYIIAPADVDLLWEGNTYVPPFYRGKTYPDGESTILLWAVPHIVANGKEVPAGNLVFTWTVDGKTQPLLSGYGRSTIRISPAQLKNATPVTVVAEVPGGGTAAQASVSVPTVTPVLVTYENRPLSGLWTERAAPSPFHITSDESTFKVVPFFVANPSLLTFSWSLDGKNFTPPGSDPSQVTFRTSGQGGSATASVSVQKQGSIFERLAASLELSYQ